MHSRIFQVSREPITEENKISEYRYDEGFVGNNGVDYVVPTDNRQADLEWLTFCHRGIKVETSYDITKKGITKLTIVSKEEYFEEKFNEFQEGLKKLSDYTLSDFINNANWLKIVIEKILLPVNQLYLILPWLLYRLGGSGLPDRKC